MPSQNSKSFKTPIMHAALAQTKICKNLSVFASKIFTPLSVPLYIQTPFDGVFGPQKRYNMFPHISEKNVLLLGSVIPQMNASLLRQLRFFFPSKKAFLTTKNGIFWRNIIMDHGGLVQIIFLSFHG